ncbi:unnamed protein product [Effrenium voratum]|nr:unnamed protein product [Effrenium voratum]
MHLPMVKAARHLYHAVLALLGSACCALQLLLNALGAGCGGFNKHLGPMRPLFLGLLLASMVTTRQPFQVLLQLSIAFLPEMVQLRNLTVHRKTRKLKPTLEVELVLPTMGCVACINQVNRTLRQLPAVVSSEAWLDVGGGRAKVRCDADKAGGAAKATQRMREAMSKAGFEECTVESVREKH